MNDEVKVAEVLAALLRGSIQPGFQTSNVPNYLVIAAAKYIEDRMLDDFRAGFSRHGVQPMKQGAAEVLDIVARYAGKTSSAYRYIAEALAAKQPEQQGAGDEMPGDLRWKLDNLRPSSCGIAGLSAEEWEYVRGALAARQPVGHIDEAALLRRAAAVLDMLDGYPDETGYMGDFADACDILEILAQHTAPPAQVDLSDVRRELSDALDLLDNTTAEGDEDANRIGLAELAITRVVERIDQQAGKWASR